MLGREHATDGGRFDRAEQEAGERQRQQLVQVGPLNRGEAERRQSLRHVAQQLHAARVEAEHAEATMPPTTTNRATGLFLRKIFPSTSTASAATPIRRARRDWFRPGA